MSSQAPPLFARLRASVMGVVVALAAVMMLAACGSGLPSTSPPPPLATETSAAAYCLTARPGEAVVLGSDLLRNNGSSVLTVRQLKLVDPSGLKLVGAYVLPVYTPLMVGNGWSYPITSKEAKEFENGVLWSDSFKFLGLHIPPTTQGIELNVVLGLQATGTSPGSAAGLEIDYTSPGGTHYQFETPTRVTVDVSPQHC